VTTHRPRQILRWLDEGCTVLYNDLDSAWVRPVFPVLDALGVHDIVVANDDLGGGPGYLCTCFLYVQPTAASRAFMEEWASAAAGQKRNQPAFNEVVAKNNTRATISVLPMSEFPPGGRLKERKDINSTVVAHANYLVGTQGKERRLEDLGLWHPEGNCGLGL